MLSFPGFLIVGNPLPPAEIRPGPPLAVPKWQLTPVIRPGSPICPVIAPNVMNICGQESELLVRAAAQAVKRATLLVLPISIASVRMTLASIPQIAEAHSGVFGMLSYVPRT